MYSDKQFADEICRIVDPKDVHTGAQIIRLVEEKFTSTNSASNEIAAEIYDITRRVDKGRVMVLRDTLLRWARRLRA